MSEENKALVRRLEEAWDGSDTDTVTELLAPNFVSHSTPPGMPPGVESAKMAHQLTMQAFPNRKVTIEDIFGEGDKVVVRCRTIATNTGAAPWLGVPEPTGKNFDFKWISIYRVTGGKIAEHWGLNDGSTLMQQLGVMQGM